MNSPPTIKLRAAYIISPLTAVLSLPLFLGVLVGIASQSIADGFAATLWLGIFWLLLGVPIAYISELALVVLSLRLGKPPELVSNRSIIFAAATTGACVVTVAFSLVQEIPVWAAALTGALQGGVGGVTFIAVRSHEMSAN